MGLVLGAQPSHSSAHALVERGQIIKASKSLVSDSRSEAMPVGLPIRIATITLSSSVLIHGLGSRVQALPVSLHQDRHNHIEQQRPRHEQPEEEVEETPCPYCAQCTCEVDVAVDTSKQSHSRVDGRLILWHLVEGSRLRVLGLRIRGLR